MGQMTWVAGSGQLAGQDPTLDALVAELRRLAEEDAGSVTWTCRGRRVDETRYVVELEHVSVGGDRPASGTRRHTKFLLQGAPRDVVAHFAAYLGGPFRA
jgi:hypothetical protein